MSREQNAVSQEEFAGWVRDVLKRLYDAPYLQSHPLASLLLDEEARRATASQSLRQVILDAIQALRPGPGVPAQSADWRAYRILELRYLEGLTRAEIMAELGVAKSQFFRDLSRVLGVVTRNLWERYRAQGASAPGAGKPLVQMETERLAASARWESLGLAQIIGELQPVLLPLTSSRGIQLECRAATVTPLRADRVMLRQVLVNLILYLASLPGCTAIQVADLAQDDRIALQVRAQRATAPPAGAVPPEQRQREGMCRQIMAAMDGQISFQAEAGSLHAVLSWPGAHSRLLLVVDDNEGLIDLYRRYLADQDWQVLGARNGREAWQALQKARPAAILLDIMMPGEDGWDLLVQLKALPEAQHIPVLICSVVNEPELARSLGAAANLPKPVAQKALLDALSRLVH